MGAVVRVHRAHPVGKRGGAEGTKQEYVNARLIELARADHLVVRLKGGDPFVFGRGGELNALTAAGIDVVVVPGTTSALAAPAAAGIPATMRGISSSIAIVTAQRGGSIDGILQFAQTSDTLIVLKARSNLEEVANVVARAVIGTRLAVLVSNATLPDQCSVTGPVADIALLADREQIEAPATLIVGDVVAASQTLARLVIAS
jgi:siroheme synthase